MIRYENKIPSKIEYYEILKTNKNEEIVVSEIAEKLENTVTAVCAYKGERIVGFGRISKEQNNLCIDDLIVKLDAYKEEIEREIIVKLIHQMNVIKLYDTGVQKRLNENADLGANIG